MARPSAKKDEKDEAYRSSLTLPAETAAALMQHYKNAAPRDGAGKELSFGRWMAETALAKLDGKAEAPATASTEKMDFPGKDLEKAAARGAAAGVVKSLDDFAGTLGRLIGERLLAVEQRIEGVESILNAQAALYDDVENVLNAKEATR